MNGILTGFDHIIDISKKVKSNGQGIGKMHGHSCVLCNRWVGVVWLVCDNATGVV